MIKLVFRLVLLSLVVLGAFFVASSVGLAQSTRTDECTVSDAEDIIDTIGPQIASQDDIECVQSQASNVSGASDWLNAATSSTTTTTTTTTTATTTSNEQTSQQATPSTPVSQQTTDENRSQPPQIVAQLDSRLVIEDWEEKGDDVLITFRSKRAGGVLVLKDITADVAARNAEDAYKLIEVRNGRFTVIFSDAADGDGIDIGVLYYKSLDYIPDGEYRIVDKSLWDSLPASKWDYTWSFGGSVAITSLIMVVGSAAYIRRNGWDDIKYW